MKIVMTVIQQAVMDVVVLVNLKFAEMVLLTQARNVMIAIQPMAMVALRRVKRKFVAMAK